MALLWLICGLLVLIPLSIDNLWNISFGEYDARVNYVGAALAMLLALAQFRGKFVTMVREHFQGGWVLAFGAMALVGAIGTAFSLYQTRSVFFLVWTMGTLFLVPLLAKTLVAVFREWAPRAFILYLGAQSLVILLDAAVCIPTDGKYSIARTMIMEHASAGKLCRPHAWYQEPGFFCAFSLLAMIAARYWLALEKSRVWKRVTLLALILSVLATVATTSRLGWLGVLILAVCELTLVQRKYGFARDWRTSLKRFLKTKAGVATIIVPLIALATVTVIKWDSIYHHEIRGVVSPTSDSSIMFRFHRVKTAMEVFEKRPLFGAGPGGAGALYVDIHMHGKPLEGEWAFQRRDPLSQNLYTEILSEWGLLGTLAFFIGLYLLFSPVPMEFRMPTFLALGVIYLSTQTLPRFDLWFALGMILALAQWQRLPNFKVIAKF